MSNTPSIPMLDPQGNALMIPQDQQQAAMQAGAKPAVKMIDPQGSPRWIPQDQQQAALQAGGKLADTPPPSSTYMGLVRDPAQDIQNFMNEAKGIAKGAANTAAGALDTYASAPGGVVPGATPGTSAGVHKIADWLRTKAGPIQGTYQSEGNIAETVAELMAMPEAGIEEMGAKIPTLAEHLANGSELAKFLSKSPKIAAMLRIALDATKTATRGAVEQGAQTYVKTGGDTEQAGEAAKVGAEFGGIVGAGTSAVGETARAMEASRPKTKTFAGADFQTYPKTGNLILKPSAQGDAATQAVDQATGNIAKTGVANSLLRANADRAPEPAPLAPPSRMLPAPQGSTPGFPIQTGETTPTGEGQISLPARKKQIGTRAVAGKGPGEPYNASSFAYGDAEPLPQVSDLGNQPSGSHREPVYQYLTSPRPAEAGNVVTDTPMGGGGVHILTSDGQASSVGKARAQLAQYDNILKDDETVSQMGVRQHQQLLDAREDLADQLSRYDNYLTTQPHFPQHDVLGAVQNTNSLGEAAQVLKDSHAPFWQKADEATQNEFSDLREKEKFLEKQLYSDSPTRNYEDLQQQLKDNRQSQMDLFDKHRTQFSPQEWETARNGYQDGIVLSNLNDLIQSNFNGVTRAEEARSVARGGTLYREFAPAKTFNKQLEKFYNDGTNGEVLQRTIGQNHMDSLKEIGQLFENGERQKATKTLIEHVGAAYRRHLYLGGGAGAGIGGTMAWGLGHGLGAIAGAAGGAAGVGALAAGTISGATHYITEQMATNPEFAKSFLYAVKNGISPRFAAPLLAMRLAASSSVQPSIQERQVVKEEKERGIKPVTLPVTVPAGAQPGAQP